MPGFGARAGRMRSCWPWTRSSRAGTRRLAPICQPGQDSAPQLTIRFSRFSRRALSA